MTEITLSITQDAYEKLIKLKKPNEDINMLLKRLILAKNLQILKSLQGTITYPNKKEILEDIKTKRKQHRFKSD